MLKATHDDGRPRIGRVPLFPLDVRGLSYSDRGRILLRDITFRLGASHRTVIMGPNGAGKSLLLRLMHGLIKPAGGTITWAGSETSDAVRSQQALVFQRATLLRRSVEANIRFVLRHLPTAEQKERTSQILETAKLRALAAMPARLLSGGEQQRLALARACALEPAVLFLDEPCSSLDPASTLAVEEMIENVHADGAKIILVTHDTGQARRLADEVMFLHNGSIAELTPAKQFFEHPSSPAALAYLEGRIVL